MDGRLTNVHASEKGFTLVTFGRDMSVQAGSRGFTIFELMITVAIAAIISAFAIPGFQDLMARNRINSVAEEVATSLASARTTAVTQRRTVVLEPATTEDGWMVYLDCPPSATCPTSQSIESHEVIAPMTITHAPSTVTEVSFRSSGMVVKSKPTPEAPIDLVITICDEGRTNEIGKDVSISRVGKITSRLHADASTCNP